MRQPAGAEPEKRPDSVNLAILNIAVKVLRRTASFPPLRNSVLGCYSKVSAWGCERGGMTQPDRRVSPQRRGGPRGDSLPQLGAGASGPGAAPQRGLSRGAGLPGRAGGGTRGGCEGARPGARRAVLPGPGGPARVGGARRISGAEQSTSGWRFPACAMRSAAGRNGTERSGWLCPARCRALVRYGAAARVRSPWSCAEPTAWCDALGREPAVRCGASRCGGMRCGVAPAVQWDAVGWDVMRYSAM